jgi:hypothetical protein
MEPKAGVFLLEDIYMRGKVPIYTLIGDDDSTLTANMKHSMKARIAANQMDATEWPRGNPTASNPRGAKKPDHGCLPLHVPEVKIELADPTHRCKVVCKHLFNYASKAKSINTCGLTNQDCQRLKTNYGYFIKSHRHLPVNDVVKNAPSIYNHHFNDHSGCGLWCPYSPLLPEEKIKILSEKEAKGKYRNKTDHLPMYKTVVALIGRFLTKECLSECCHPHDSQLNEALNSSVASYAPKHKDFSTSTSLKCRVAFAAGAHSVTLKGLVSMYCELVGIDMTFARQTFFTSANKQNSYHSNYKTIPRNKRKRAAGKKEKQKVAFKAKKKDKKDGTEYLSGVRLNMRIDEQTHKGEKLCVYYLFIHLCIYEIQY